MTTEAFCPVSNTFSLDVTAASQALAPTITPAPAAADIQTGGMEYRFSVVGTVPVFVNDAEPGAAAPVAIYPTTGANQNGVLILPNTTVTLKLVYGTQLAVISTGAGSTIHVCIGRGIVA